MKSTSLLLLLFLSSIYLQAQHYSFISDRRFFEPADMIGYDFKPTALEIPDQEEREIDPGEYSFGITFNYLYVKGEGIEGVYNINNMQPTDYGFKILLMNARDARLQGHLKVIQNKYGMVEVLIFKRSSNDKEIIFYLAPITKKLKEQEKAYFTDRGELIIEHADSIWGEEVRPFLIMHMEENVQQRLQLVDSVYITFTEEVTIEEKEIKTKKSKKDKRNKKEELTEGATDEESREILAEGAIELTKTDTLSPADSTTMNAPEVKIKITKEYFLTVYSNVMTDMGIREMDSKKYPIKKINEKEDASAGLHEERYLWELANDKKVPINMYLNGDRSVSTLEIDGKKYLMRGF